MKGKTKAVYEHYGPNKDNRRPETANCAPSPLTNWLECELCTKVVSPDDYQKHMEAHRKDDWFMEPIHIISLGAGVQSSTMALMAAVGELTPMPQCAIFADTQDEPKSVYLWLNWLCGVPVKYRPNGEACVDPGSYRSGTLPYPVRIVSKGKLSDASLRVHRSAGGNLYTNSNIPVFLKMPNGERQGLQSRQCTSDFKIKIIQKEIRQIAAIDIAVWRAEVRHKRKFHFKPVIAVPVVQWMGISRDEVIRMKPSLLPYIKNIWPLIDKGMSRLNCEQWMKSHGYPAPPRSACVQCPYHSDREWLRLKTEEPEGFEQAAKFEEKYQGSLAQLARVRGIPYLHRSMIPLREIDFSEKREPSLFGNECEGMCGV